MAICKLCGQDFPAKELFTHKWEDHREEMLKVAQGARQKDKKRPDPKPPSNGNASGAKPAASLGEAAIITIAPKRFEITSLLLWQAKLAAIKEWGWDPQMSDEDFLDTYLFESFRQRGIVLGAYQVVEAKNGNSAHR